MRFVVEFTGKLPSGQTQPVTLAVDVPADAPAACRIELAWDEYKRKTGLRRWQGDTPPIITREDAGDDSSGNSQPGNSADQLRGKARGGQR